MKIQQLDINASFEVNGVRFHGLKDLLARVEATYNVGSKQMTKRSGLHFAVWPFWKSGNKIHIGLIEERYPCFDSEDFLNETRYYRNFIFRNHKLTENDFTETLSLCPMQTNCCLVTKQLPENLTPMLYYEGEGELMYIAL